MSRTGSNSFGNAHFVEILSFSLKSWGYDETSVGADGEDSHVALASTKVSDEVDYFR